MGELPKDWFDDLYRDKLAKEIFIIAMSNAENLGQATERERKQVLKYTSSICFEAAEAFIEICKEKYDDEG